jgi:hypothetical protein
VTSNGLLGVIFKKIVEVFIIKAVRTSNPASEIGWTLLLQQASLRRLNGRPQFGHPDIDGSTILK